jgi:hypothetical protein
MTKRQAKAPKRRAKSRKPAQPSVRADSKQAQVIALMRRPQGATLDEMQKATDWQRHTVRGAISGAIKKKLGLRVIAEKTERGRIYRINDSTSKRAA